MPRRKWGAKSKALIVLEGLQGKPGAELCPEHQISQRQYYQGRAQFLANAAHAFAVHRPTREEAHLGQENARWKQLVRGAHLRVQQKRRAIGGTRPRSLRVIQRDEVLLPRIEALEVGHPFWGDRRIWAHVRCVEQLPGNKKRVLRVMREHRLLVPPDLRLNAERTPMRDKPTPTHPNAWWGIDMTEVLVEDFGWVSIVLGLGWYAKKIVGYHAGMQGAARHWLAALHMAVNGPFPAGVEGKRLALMSDNGCQPTSIAFMKTCSTLGISQAFTSDHNPKGNAETERVIRTLKEECLWFREWPCPVELFQALEHWISYDNEPYLHSALAEKTPAQFERDYDNGQRPPFLAA